MQRLWGVLIALLTSIPLLAETRLTPVVHLGGSMDGEDSHPVMYFDYRELNLQLDATDPKRSEAFDRLTVFLPRVDDPEDERPYPNIRTRAGEHFDPEQVYVSEDGSVVIVKAVAGNAARWLFVDAKEVKLIGQLPAAQVIIDDSQLSWEGAAAALDQRLQALAPLDAWERALWPQHEVSIRDARNIVEDWFVNHVSPEFDAAGLQLIRDLFNAPVQPIEPRALIGRWRVRSIQASSYGVFVYPYFAATIEAAGEQLKLSKTTGSQRRQGLLFQSRGGKDGLIFLGGATVNDDPPVAYSGLGPDRQAPLASDSVGVLTQLGPDHLILLLDARYGSSFEIYELKR